MPAGARTKPGFARVTSACLNVSWTTAPLGAELAPRGAVAGGLFLSLPKARVTSLCGAAGPLYAGRRRGMRCGVDMAQIRPADRVGFWMSPVGPDDGTMPGAGNGHPFESTGGEISACTDKLGEVQVPTSLANAPVRNWFRLTPSRSAAAPGRA